MPGQVLKKRRLVNPGRRRRMTPGQIKYFGTKRQKAALRNRRHHRNTGRRRRNQGGIVSQAEHAAAGAIRAVERAAEDAIHSVTGVVNPGRRRNVGEILTVIPAGNPGKRRRKNRMAATRRNRRRVVHNRRRMHNRRRRRNPTVRRRHNRRRSMNPKVIVRYRNRRHNRHRGRRRRNPGLGALGPEVNMAVGTVAGLLLTTTITKTLTTSTGFIPSTGIMAVLATGVVGFAQGMIVRQFNRSLGTSMTIGGLAAAVYELLAQYFPAFTLPCPTTSGTSGLGLLTSSNFYVPQVNLPGSMASFVAPAAIPAPVVMSGGKMSGLGYGSSQMRTFRRTGRLR